jgi:hypothetical protein
LTSLPDNIPPERYVSAEGHIAKSKASTVQEYLDELPDDRRPVVEAVRKTNLKSLPKGYREAMNWEVINYEFPWNASRIPTTGILLPTLGSPRRRTTTYST